MIFLPIPIWPEYPWPGKLLIAVINWVTWIIPAAEDTFATDTGSDYQNGAALIFIVGGGFSVMQPLGLYWVLEQNGLLIGATFGLVTYLAAGALYFLHRRRWAM